MSVLAKLLSGLWVAFFNFFSGYFTVIAAARYAQWVLWAGTFVTFVASVLVCLQLVHSSFGAALSALGPPSSSNWVGYFGVGLGMVIPANAPALLACMASVWVTCQAAKFSTKGLAAFKP